MRSCSYEGVRLLRQVLKCIAVSTLLSLGLLALREARRHAVRTLKWPPEMWGMVGLLRICETKAFGQQPRLCHVISQEALAELNNSVAPNIRASVIICSLGFPLVP